MNAREYLIRNGIKWREVAQKMGCSIAYLHMILCGKRLITPKIKESIIDPFIEMTNGIVTLEEILKDKKGKCELDVCPTCLRKISVKKNKISDLETLEKSVVDKED